MSGNAISLTGGSSPGVAAYIWNNSIEGGVAGAHYCARSDHRSTGTTIAVEDNLCAFAHSSTTHPAQSASSTRTDHNLRSRAGRARAPRTRTYSVVGDTSRGAISKVDAHQW